MYNTVQTETFEADRVETAMSQLEQLVRLLSLRLPQDIIEYKKEICEQNDGVKLSISWYWKERQ